MPKFKMPSPSGLNLATATRQLQDSPAIRECRVASRHQLVHQVNAIHFHPENGSRGKKVIE